MSKHTFYQLDVFTGTPLAGNPLAVFPEAAGFSDTTMQAIAREMKLSETACVFDSDKATKRVRFFTPAAEIPLAGHPTIGTWWLLAELGALDIPQNGTVRLTQETGAGILPVDIYLESGAPTEVAMTQPLPDFGALVADRERLGTALGGSGTTVEEQPTAQVVATALPQLMVSRRGEWEEASPHSFASSAPIARCATPSIRWIPMPQCIAACSRPASAFPRTPPPGVQPVRWRLTSCGTASCLPMTAWEPWWWHRDSRSTGRAAFTPRSPWVTEERSPRCASADGP